MVTAIAEDCLGRGVTDMPEFFRSSAIMLMGLTVMAAGVAVVLYG